MHIYICDIYIRYSKSRGMSRQDVRVERKMNRVWKLSVKTTKYSMWLLQQLQNASQVSISSLCYFKEKVTAYNFPEYSLLWLEMNLLGFFAFLKIEI